MAVKINWSVEADETFRDNIDYLSREWSAKEVEKFTSKTQEIIRRLQLFPES
jgi:plasmid stabilization system protein ParE